MIGKRHHFLITLLLTTFVVSAHAEKIRTAIPGANLNYLTVYSADERRFFRDEGFDNETIAIGGPAGIAALVSGDVDFSGAGGSGLRAAVRGAPLKAIFYQTEKPTWYLVVHPSITQGADLKGKKIGVALLGDSEDRFITLYAERAGVAAKELTRISLGTGIGDKILGVKTGNVAAVVLDPAGTVVAEREGLRKLTYMGDHFTLPFQGYVATHQKLAENPSQVKRWIRAMTRSLLFVRDRPEEAADIALRRLRLRNITKPMLVEAIRSYTRAFPPGVPGVPSAEGVKSILENELRIPLKLDKPLAPENFFELRWAEEVRKEFTAKGTNP